MPNHSHSVRRERLLAQQQLPGEHLAKYRMEVDVILEKKAKAVARERTLMRWAWSYLVVLSTAFVVISGFRNDSVQGLWFCVMACFWLLLGSTFLTKQLMNQHALETLEALKRLEVQLLAQTRRGSELDPTDT
jgi:hypothetical protein